MTGQSAQMMEFAKQNVPHTLEQGSGITPNVHVSASASQSAEGHTPVNRCAKCNQI
jgi:hypothetical protein